jgi:hypothetical protein
MKQMKMNVVKVNNPLNQTEAPVLWDFCFVFPVKDKAKEGILKGALNNIGLDVESQNNTPTNEKNKTYDSKFIKQMNDAGLETKVIWGAARDALFCKVGAPLQRLKVQADLLDSKFELDMNVLKELTRAGFPEYGIAPIDL